MSESDKQHEGRSLTSLLGRRRITITGIHQGDLRVEKPVVIAEGATAVADIFAPQVTVSGLVLGVIIARQVKIAASGQVWGDVQASHLEIESGGRIQGWVSDISETEYEALLAGETIIHKRETPDPSRLPTDFAEVMETPRGDEETAAMCQLREKAAEALLARAELESVFEERVMEAAGERAARAASLEQELGVVREALEDSRQEKTSLASELDRLRERLERQTELLTETQDELAARERTVAEVQGDIIERDLELDRQHASNRDAEARLQARRQQIDKLESRIESLEAALQASLQTENEQAQALQRWQESVDESQQQLRALEKQLAATQKQADEPTKMATLQQHLQKSDEQLAQLLAELQAKDMEIGALQEQLLWQTAENENAQSELAHASELNGIHEKRIGKLEAELAEAQAKLMAGELRLQEAGVAAEEQVARLKAELREQAILIGRMNQVSDDRFDELEERPARDT